MANDITLGALKITRTYKSIGIEWQFTGDDNGDATLLAYFRRTGDSVWREYVNNQPFSAGARVGLNKIIPTLATTITTYGTQRVFLGSFFDLDAGTNYDLKLVVSDADGVTCGATVTTTLNGSAVADSTRTASAATTATVETASGAIATRNDDAPSRATVLATPTHHVNASTGNDANAGTSSGAAWKTLNKAFSSAPSGAIVKMYGGSLAYAAPTTTRTLPLTLIADNAAVDDGGRNGSVINEGSQVVVEDGVQGTTTNEIYGTAPTGTTPDANYPAGRVGPWTRVTSVEEPDIGGAGSRVLWKFDIRGGGSQTLDSSNAMTQMGYSTTRQGLRRRIPNYKSSSTQCDTLIEFCNLIFQPYQPGVTNTQQWGFWAHPSQRHFVYVRMPGDADPNVFWTTIGGGTGFIFGNGAQDSRVSGLHIRGFATGVDQAPGTTPDRGMIDHCRFSNFFSAIRFEASTAGIYSVDWTVEDCIFGDSDMWVAGHLSINRGFIKSDMAGTTGGPKLGANEENQAIFDRGGSNRLTFRRNRLVQIFNGLTSFNATLSGAEFDRYCCSDRDIYECHFEGVGDDCIEPETIGSRWCIWDCSVKDAYQMLSITPLRFGPVYMDRVTTQNTPSADGIDSVGAATLVGSILKYGNTSPTDLVPEIFILFSTWWGDFVAAEGGQQANNSGGATQPRIYLWGNIGKAGRYAWESASLNHWYEDYNLLGSNSATNGMQFGGVNYTAVAGYRTASGQGAHTNKVGGTDYAYNNGVLMAAIKPLLTDPDNGNNIPKAGANALVGTCLARGNVADVQTVGGAAPSRLYEYSGSAPSFGYREPDFVAAEITLPTAPSGLGATVISDAQIDLAWTDNASDETSYRVEESASGTTGWTLVATLPADSASYSHTGLASLSTHYYRVGAANSAGVSYGNVAGPATTQETAATPPAAASNVSAIPLSSSSIRVDWLDNASNETFYLVIESPNGIDNWLNCPNQPLGVNANSFVRDGLAPEQTLYFLVFAKIATGQPAPNDVLVSDQSNLASATTLPASPSSGGGRSTTARTSAVRTTAVRTSRPGDVLAGDPDQPTLAAVIL